MRVEVDRGRCVGAGMCVLTEPAVFDQDDDGTVLLLDPAPPAAGHAAVRDAALVCPAGAITVQDGPR
ncbi:ferredoxin [Umezawaea sp.]|uniref:ferredoxin n=1 Tax=Umezawaea sp. TaxID=1955258 RepID=UPI002ED55CCA